MGKLIVTEYITLDGVMEDPGGQNTFKGASWHFPFLSEDARQWKHEELFRADAYLLGRRTYEEFAGAWPQVTDETGFADRMNGMPKYVVSTTLTAVEWNNSRLIQGDPAQAIQALKQEAAQDILLAGSGQLVRLLEAHNLVDEYRFLVHPIVVGTGATLFKDLTARRALKLVEARPFERGIVLLRYQPE